MKILKRPVGLVYDTERPEEFEYTPESPVSDPLHHVTEQTDYDFLKEHFSDKNHPVFNDFANSFFYKLED